MRSPASARASRSSRCGSSAAPDTWSRSGRPIRCTAWTCATRPHPVTGELKINGYSAYLHPAGDGRLIGVGQDATDRGRVTGTQVSLFDVADPARPARIAQHHVPGGWSEAEHDPHAFLYWEPERLVVLPVRQPGVVTDRADGTGRAVGRCVALRVGDRGFTVAGAVDHPGALADGGEWRRSAAH
ncbi:beta-propeller domain-containing protein [Micromonospora sp. BRA006-A]|nr:beta-propeller domain-containing protein [Micromonospora sp. BRA006-A]